MSDIDKFVVKIENGNVVDGPIPYSNFLELFPNCVVQEIPTNEVIAEYGYNVYIYTLYPTYKLGPYIQKEDGTWTNTWVKAN